MKMPTNFTVVPVKDGRRTRKKNDDDDDEEDNNVLREEDEDAALPGESVGPPDPLAGGLRPHSSRTF